MGRYLLKRLLLALPTLLGVMLIVFVAIRLIPGDPASAMLGPEATPQQISAFRHDLGLDRPMIVQVGIALRDYASGHLGSSIRSHRPVLQEILTRYPYTLELALAAMLIGIVCGISLGVLAATRRGSLLDLGLVALSSVGISAPVFWSGLLLSAFFAIRLGWFPTVGGGKPGDLVSQLHALVLPAVTLGIAATAFIARMTRSSMVEVLSADHVRTNRAKGLPERSVILRHALKNAAVPITTVIGYYFGMMLGGAVIIETVFARPGLGKLLVDSVLARDYPVVQGVVLFAALNLVVVTLLTDLAYGALDPRIRQRQEMG